MSFSSIDRLQVLQRLDRPVDRLLANRVVQVRRRIARVQLLRQLELLGAQAVALFLEIGLAEIAADDRVLDVERRRGLDVVTAAVQVPFADLCQAETKVRERIPGLARNRAFERRLRRRGPDPRQLGKSQHRLRARQIRRNGRRPVRGLNAPCRRSRATATTPRDVRGRAHAPADRCAGRCGTTWSSSSRAASSWKLACKRVRQGQPGGHRLRRQRHGPAGVFESAALDCSARRR